MHRESKILKMLEKLVRVEAKYKNFFFKAFLSKTKSKVDTIECQS
jgi:hypothetical protein